MLNCAVWAILLFVASCMIADDARSVRHYCSIMSCNHLIAGAVSIPFIFFNFYFPEIRSSRSTTSVVKKKKKKCRMKFLLDKFLITHFSLSQNSFLKKSCFTDFIFVGQDYVCGFSVILTRIFFFYNWESLFLDLLRTI